MAHASGVGAGKKYRGLPGEEEYAHQTYVRRFEEIYSNDVNPESLYKAQINNFVRFAKIHPHVAFLLEQLRLIFLRLAIQPRLGNIRYLHRPSVSQAWIHLATSTRKMSITSTGPASY